MQTFDISIVIPVFNEENNLEELFKRLTVVLDSIKKSWEVIFVNDGSKDRSIEILRSFYKKRPRNVKIIDFNGNFGQHMAIMAALEMSSGEIVITIDADLQNPPEEIHKLLEGIKNGADYVGTFRKERKDFWFRKFASKLNNFLREKTTKIKMKDQGCMLRAYKRSIIDAIILCREHSIFIPALAYKFATNYQEIEVEHSERRHDKSKYTLYKLLRLNFDLMTGFTLLPLQMFTMFGFFVSGGSGILVAYLLTRRFIFGPEAEGLFTLFAISFFLISVVITGIGLIGEYVGRTYREVKKHPRYVIKEILGLSKTNQPNNICGTIIPNLSDQSNSSISIHPFNSSESISSENFGNSCSSNVPKVVFFGYSQMGYDCLKLLIERGVKIVGVFTHEDDQNEFIWFDSVIKLAIDNGIPFYTFSNLKDTLVANIFDKLKPNLLICSYYRRLIPDNLLSKLSLGAYNLHGSLLPKYRGKCPVNWAILNGEKQTGITLHEMEKRADTGAIIDQSVVEIDFKDDVSSVMKKLCLAAKLILDRQLVRLLSGNVKKNKQDDLFATKYEGRKPSDGIINWNSSTLEIYNLIRAITKPYPGAFTIINGKKLIIWQANPNFDDQKKLSTEHTKSNKQPGEILNDDPLIIATKDGSLEIISHEWQKI